MIDQEQARCIKKATDRALITEIGLIVLADKTLSDYGHALVAELLERYYQVKHS